MHIHADITVDELIGVHPEIASFLAERGIICTRCGEPYWGTLRELAGLKGLQGQIDRIVTEIVEELKLDA